MGLKSELEENPYAPPLVEDFYKTALEYRDNFENEEEFQEALRVWPRCPSCGRRRITRCPICKTSGNLFPLGDPSFWNENARETNANERPTCRSLCNRCDKLLYDESESPSTMAGEIFPGAPSLRRAFALREKTSDAFDELPESREPTTKDDERSLVALCHICSEAFAPKFLNTCEWCGYEFEREGEQEFDPNDDPEGVLEFLAERDENGPNEDLEANEGRVFLTTLVLVAIFVFLFVYFATL